MLRSAAAVVLGLAFALPASAETLTLASQYDASGTNTDGSKYTGKVSIDVISDATFNIRWDIAGSTYTGFGMRMNDALAATYTIMANRVSSSTRSTTTAFSTASGPFAARAGTAPSD
jgi:hypothetical protein